MTPYKTIYTTERSPFHQERAIAAAPPDLDIIMLRYATKADLIEHLTDTTFLISERTGVIDKEIITAAPNLKMILRLGSLTHDIDVAAAKEAGVIVCRWSDAGVIRVAEHAIMQLLTLTKKVREVQKIALEASEDWLESKRTDENTFAYNWSRRQGIMQLYQHTIGIIGFGEISAEITRRLSGWGCSILYNKRRRLPDSVETELGIMYVEKETLWEQSDYIINLLPYFPETDMSINAESFAKMKAGSLIVSVGSGSVIDESALADAVRSGHLAGAAIDTYEWEPILKNNPLRQLAFEGYNILLTPHTAAGSSTAKIADKERASDFTNIINFLEDKPIINRLV